MKNFSRILLLLLVVVMLLQTASIGIFAFQPVDIDTSIYQAAGTGYTKSSDVKYVYVSDAWDNNYVRQEFRIDTYNDFIAKVRIKSNANNEG